MWYKKFLYILLLIVVAAEISFAFKETYYTYVEGLLAIQRGNYEDAVEKFEYIITKDTQAIEVAKQLLYLYILTGKIERVKNFTPFILDNITDIELLISIGNLLWLDGENDIAIKFFNKVLEIDPQNKTAILSLAQINFSSDTQKSSELYSQYLKDIPEDIDVLFQSALTEYRLGNYDTAKKMLKKVVESQPDNVIAKVILSDLLCITTDYLSTEVEKGYIEYLEKFPEDYHVMLKLVILLFIKEKYDVAEKYIKKLEQIPKKEFTAEHSYFIAMFYEYKKDFKKAIRFMEKCIKLQKSEHPENLLAHIKVSYYYIVTKKFNKAKEKLNYVIKKYDNLNAKIMLALLYIDIKKYVNAIKLLENIVQSPQNFPKAYFYLGYCYDQIGKFELAEKYFLESISKNPNDHESLNYLGYSYVEKNIKLDVAKEYIEKALLLDPGNPAYEDSLGWLYYRQGEYIKAEEIISNAAQKINDPIIFDHLGDIKVKLNKKEQAIEFYKKSLQLDPKNKKIKLKLKNLLSELKQK